MGTQNATTPPVRNVQAESQPKPLSAPKAAVSMVSPTRLMSIDALRGFDMFWIIGADVLFAALKQMTANPMVQAAANQLEHVAWEGFRFYDLIFPLFVFIVGVSLVFSLSRRIAENGRSAALVQLSRRALILYVIGILYYDGIANGFDQIRLMGVLQRLAICYFFAGLAFCFFKTKGLVICCASLLLGYWALMTFMPVPGVGAGNFEEGKNFANYVDKEYLPLRKWDVDHDPEGLLSNLPAIASCLLGALAGLLLKSEKVAPSRKTLFLVAGGTAALLVGYLWSFQFPIIKKIWTSSFALVAGGFSALFLALFYQIIDVWKWQRWAKPFIWIGMNSITIYLITDLINVTNLAKRLAGGEIKIMMDTAVTPGFGDLVIVAAGLAICFWFVHFLYQRKIFLRI
ncbi:MAG: acyltransferase family protein [Verrucomicrobiales bacterium]